MIQRATWNIFEVLKNESNDQIKYNWALLKHILRHTMSKNFTSADKSP